MAKDERLIRFGRRLRELREARGMSRKELVDSAGLSERAIIKWELGEREPGWFNVVALAHALRVDLEAFTEEPEDTPAPERGRPRKASAADQPDQAGAGPGKPADKGKRLTTKKGKKQ